MLALVQAVVPGAPMRRVEPPFQLLSAPGPAVESLVATMLCWPSTLAMAAVENVVSAVFWGQPPMVAPVLGSSEYRLRLTPPTTMRVWPVPVSPMAGEAWMAGADPNAP